MPRITPIPTMRVSDLLAQQRQLHQLQSNQVDVLRIQQQISTLRRINYLSEDAPAGMRAVALLRLLEQKDQIKKNLSSNDAFLTETDTTLARVSEELSQAKAEALGVTGIHGSDFERQTVADLIDKKIEHLLGIANHSFRGRYLFAGSRTGELPFDQKGQYIRYNGNETHLQNFGDIDLLFDTNVTGSEVFGAISKPVVGTVDLNPNLSADTKLSDLNHGEGVSLGSIEISDGTTTSIVDLSAAHTIDDVVGLIEANPPAGRTVTVEIKPTGLNVSLDATGGGDLRIHEIDGGSTAGDLGILSETSFGTGPVVGGDLDPLLRPSTRLADALGSNAYALLNSNGANNALRIEANDRGATFNGYTIDFVGGGIAGSETVSFNAGTQTFTVQIDPLLSTAAQIRNALNADITFSADFTASLDTTAEPGNTGSGTIDLTTIGITAHGSGLEFDQTSGLQILNGGQVHTIDISTAVTVEDLLNTLNSSPADVLAEISPDGRTLSIRSRLSGADFAIGENGGNTATHLGLRTFTQATLLEDLNHGLPPGVHPNVIGDDFLIRRKDGVELRFDVSDYNTVGDVINAINTHADNLDPNTRVVARLAVNGNGIELVDDGLSGSGQLAVEKINNSQAAEDLGLIPVGQTQASTGAAASSATATFTDAAANNDILFTASATGPQRNDVQIVFNDLGGVADTANVSFNAGTNTLTIDHNAGFTTANTVVAFVTAEGTFNATLDTTTDPGNDGTGVIGAAAGPLTTAGGTSQILTGRDTNPVESAGIFTALFRLRDALLANDAVQTERAAALVDERIDDINFVRAGVGARQQGLEAITLRLEDETVQLKSGLSDEIDIDLAEAISNLVARQAAFQAALQTTAQISRLTVLDFL
jgi:flagellin-like hook-associated protein FlgL